MAIYLGCNGVLETVVLIAHRRLATFVCNVALLAGNVIFYCTLTLLLKRPQEVFPEFCPVVDPELLARLTSVSSFFDRVDEAQQRGRASALNRIPFCAVARSLNIGTVLAQIPRMVWRTWGSGANRRSSALKSS